MLPACGALQPTAFQGKGGDTSSASSTVASEKNDDSEDAPGAPSTNGSASVSRNPSPSSADRSGPSGDTASPSRGPVASEGTIDTGPGSGSPSPSGGDEVDSKSPTSYSKKKKFVSAGDVKSAKSDPEAACLSLGPIASASEFKTSVVDEAFPKEALSLHAATPTSFELSPGEDLNALLLAQAKIPSNKKDCVEAECWKWIADFSGYVRIIETTPSGERSFVDVPVDLQTGLTKSSPKAFSIIRYNVDLQDIRAPIGSTLELVHFLDLCMMPGEGEPLILSKTLKPYTSDIQDNFAKAISHPVGFIRIDRAPMMMKKSFSAPEGLKDKGTEIKKSY